MAKSNSYKALEDCKIRSEILGSDASDGDVMGDSGVSLRALDISDGPIISG